MANIFNLILFDPIFNALIFLYKYIGDLGVAIIVLTVIIRFILYLPSRSSIKAQKAMQDIQPKLKELQNKYKNNKEELGKQMIKFYKENKVNPFSSCLPLLIQLPILIALYQTFIAVAPPHVDPNTHILVAKQLQHLYGPLRDLYLNTAIIPDFLGIADLSAKHNIILAVLAAGFQFWQSKMLMTKKPAVKDKGARDESIAANVSTQMTYLLPLFTGYIAYQFPAGLALYWVVSTIFSIVQQYYIFKKQKLQPETKPEKV